MVGWSISSFLSDMDDSAYDVFRKEFAQTHHYFTESSNYAGLCAVCNILCSEKHFSLLNHNELSTLIDSLFANEMKDIHWLAKYMDELLTYLPKDNDAKKLGYEGRADKYYKHIHDVLPNRFKNGLKDGRDLRDNDMRETIRDQVHFVFAFHNKWKAESADVKVIEDVDLSLDGNEAVSDLFFNERAPLPSTDGKKMLGIKVPRLAPIQLLPTHNMNGEDKQLAILVTRALLCDLHSSMANESEEE